MKKNHVFILIIGILNLALCFCLTYFCVADKIPVFVDLNEKIVTLCSKWLLIINVVLPLLLSIAIITLKNRPNLTFILKSIFALMIYENMLAFCYFSIETTFIVGSISEIPLAVSLFMPLSAGIILYSIKLKHMPYKCRLGIYTKKTIKTEFIWKQTQFSASELFFGAGVLSFIISIVFIFVRLPWIMLIIITLLLIAATLLTLRQTNIMYKKLLTMEKNKERVDKKKQREQEKQTEEKTNEEKA